MDFFYKNITEETANIQNKKLNTVCFILSPPLFLGENMMRSFSKKNGILFNMPVRSKSPPPFLPQIFAQGGGGLSIKQTVGTSFLPFSFTFNP